MKESEIFDHGWIDPNKELPKLIWNINNRGESYFDVIDVLLLRKLVFSDNIIYVVSIGEYDNMSIPSEWRTWNQQKDEDGCYAPGGQTVDDVIAWRYLPKIPD